MGQRRPRESKTIDFYGIGFDEMDGVVEGISAVMGNVDRVKERVLPGAFAKTISDHSPNFAKLPMGIDHERGAGVTLAMEEVGRGDLPAQVKSDFPDALGGLFCKGQAVMSDTNIALLEQMRGRIDRGQPVYMSFTYSTIRSQKAQGGVTDLAEVAVHEWGPAWRKAPANYGARVTSIKTAGAAEAKAAIAGSFEALRERIEAAIKAAGTVPLQWLWVDATLPDHVIVSGNNEGEMTRWFAVPYTQMGGEIVIGTPEEVALETTVVAKTLDAAELMTVVDRFAAQAKAGRVLSKRNLDELEAALKSLQRIWETASATDTADTDGTDEDPDGGAPAAKAVTAVDEPPRDLEALEVELGILSTRAALAAIGG